MDTLSNECCFCGKIIESTNFDPCSINVVINFDNNKKKQDRQDFLCHLVCFKNNIAPSVSVYLDYIALD